MRGSVVKARARADPTAPASGAAVDALLASVAARPCLDARAARR